MGWEARVSLLTCLTKWAAEVTWGLAEFLRPQGVCRGILRSLEDAKHRCHRASSALLPLLFFCPLVFVCLWVFFFLELKLVNLTFLEKAQIVKESAGHITELQ